MRWKIAKTFSELSAKEVYDLLKLRQDVFIIEQNCIYEDIDGIDVLCGHLLLYSSDDKLLACCRIVPAGVKLNSISIGRVVSDPKHRGMGYGQLLMNKAIEEIHKKGVKAIEIEAQTYLLQFYRSFGFNETGEPYPIDGIPHIIMKLPAS